MWKGHPGRMNAVNCQSELTSPDVWSLLSAPYRAGMRNIDFDWEEIEKLLQMHLVEPDQTEWASLIEFAPEKDGALRFCKDHRKINAVNLSDSYPIQRIDEWIDSPGEATVF